MIKTLLLLILLLSLFTISCGDDRPERPDPRSQRQSGRQGRPDRESGPNRDETAVSSLLRDMLQQDQQLRVVRRPDPRAISALVEKNTRAVLALLDTGKVELPIDYFRAARVLSLAELDDCPDCPEKAYELAKKAVEMGVNSARWLAATNLDRHLLASGEPQKYGTQSRQDRSGRWIILPTDSSTTDSERVAWAVPPLEDLQDRIDQLNQF